MRIFLTKSGETVKNGELNASFKKITLEKMKSVDIKAQHSHPCINSSFHFPQKL